VHRHAVGSIAARVIVERSQLVIQRYLRDKAAQGSVPLNRYGRARLARAWVVRALGSLSNGEDAFAGVMDARGAGNGTTRCRLCSQSCCGCT